MKKIALLSLVAAVAVAGLTTANAQPLEEAIKNVEVSGSVVYRYDNFHNAEKKDYTGAVTSDRKNDDANRYKIGLNLGSKVNDYVKFNSRFIVGSQANAGFASLNAGKETNADNTQGADGQADVSLSNAYFGLTAIPNTTVNIGKQGLTTPYTKAVDINGNEQTGTGILALTTVGPVTAGAGYFNNTNLNASTEINASLGMTVGSTIKRTDINGNNTGKDVFSGGADAYVATLQGDLDAVKLEAWYMGLQDTLNSYTLVAKSNIDLDQDAKIGLEARYVNLKLDNDVFQDDDNNKNAMYKLAVDGKFNIVNARVAYTQTDKKGGLTALDQDAENTSLGWAITSNGVENAKYWQATLGADILSNLNLSAHYGNLKSKETDNGRYGFDMKQQEVFAQLTYKMSKNLNTYLRYGKYTEKEISTGDREMDQTRGRVQVAYTF